MVETVLSQDAHLLACIKKNLILEPIRHLPDGSNLAKLYRNPSPYPDPSPIFQREFATTCSNR